jgi:hypothetical protein
MVNDTIERDRRVQMWPLDRSDLATCLQGDCVLAFPEDVPADARVIDVHYAPLEGSFMVFLAHPSFEIWPRGDQPAQGDGWIKPTPIASITRKFGGRES